MVDHSKRKRRRLSAFDDEKDEDGIQSADDALSSASSGSASSDDPATSCSSSSASSDDGDCGDPAPSLPRTFADQERESYEVLRRLPPAPDYLPDPEMRPSHLGDIRTTWKAHMSLCGRVWGQPNPHQVLPADTETINVHMREALCLVSFARKGGVGKTQTCASLAWQLALSGKRVLLFDCDSQCTLTKFLFRPSLDAFHNCFTQSHNQGNIAAGDYHHFLRNLTKVFYPEPSYPTPDGGTEPVPRSTMMDTYNALQSRESGDDYPEPGMPYSNRTISLNAYRVPNFPRDDVPGDVPTAPSGGGAAAAVAAAAPVAEVGAASAGAAAAARTASVSEVAVPPRGELLIVPGSPFIDSWNHDLTMCFTRVLKRREAAAELPGFTLASVGGVIAMTAVRYNADIVLIDMNPADTILNMFLIMQSHYLLLSANSETDASDGLRSLLNRLVSAEPEEKQRWSHIYWSLQMRAYRHLAHPEPILPPRFPKFAGCVVTFVPYYVKECHLNGGYLDGNVRASGRGLLISLSAWCTSVRVDLSAVEVPLRDKSRPADAPLDEAVVARRGFPFSELTPDLKLPLALPAEVYWGMNSNTDGLLLHGGMKPEAWPPEAMPGRQFVPCPWPPTASSVLETAGRGSPVLALIPELTHNFRNFCASKAVPFAFLDAVVSRRKDRTDLRPQDTYPSLLQQLRLVYFALHTRLRSLDARFGRAAFTPVIFSRHGEAWPVEGKRIVPADESFIANYQPRR
eukprot:TRINITY_DN136_c0_g1_i1.p1 TRINITY_DN136_c0_g1~~TRINITY_DN136_c0_g1_i1.p1  ORF type:complete len:742 (+),score=116.47 TRINITY_DN136_c0_g1_i1:204-2429(+)